MSFPQALRGAHSAYGSWVNTDYNWVDAGVQPGDTLYIKDPTNSFWIMTGHTIKALASARNNNTFYLDDCGADTLGNWVDYCIVRLHRPGVAPAGGCTATAHVGGTGLTGTFNYIWRYYNSKTAYYGLFSAVSSPDVTVANGSIDVSGWPAQPPDLDVDTLEIWRTRTDAVGAPAQVDSNYYLWKSVSLGGTASSLMGDGVPVTLRVGAATTYTDDGSVVINQTENALTDNAVAYYERAGALCLVRAHDGRLYAAQQNMLYMSALDTIEYMPSSAAQDPLATSSSAGVTQGGTVQIGVSPAEPITAMTSDMGNFSTDGVSGTDLLIFTNKRAMRWYGTDQTSFQLVAGFGFGCVNQRSLVHAGGQMVWNTGDHIVTLNIPWSMYMSMHPQYNCPVIMSQKMWPYNIRQYITAADVERCLAAWSAVFWNGWYILSGSLSAYEPDTTWVCRMPMEMQEAQNAVTWTSYPYGFNDFQLWNAPGAAGGWLLTGSVTTPQTGGRQLQGGYSANTPTGNISALWQDEARFNFSVTTAPLHFSQAPGNPVVDALADIEWKHTDRVASVWKCPVGSDVNITLQGFSDGDLSNPGSPQLAKTIPHATVSGKRTLEKWGQIVHGRYVQLTIAGTSTVPARLEVIVVEPELQGRR